MATKTITSGQTFALHGTLGAAHTLVADSGSPAYLAGAYIAVHTSALNQGTIDLLAGPSYRNVDGATGATLRMIGTLTNGGLINAAGGTDASGNRGAVDGAAVKIAHTGSLLNTGTIVLGGAQTYSLHGSHDGRSTGANLRDNGTLINDGSLLIDGSDYSGHGGGATAVIGGLLTNAGSIDIGSGSGPYGERGGILRVLATGDLVSNGQIEVGPTVARDTGILSAPAGAATLQIAGQFTNNGSLGLSQGSGRYALGAQATIFSTGTLLNSALVTVAGGVIYRTAEGYVHSTPATLTNDGVFANLGTIDIHHFGNTVIDNGVLTNDGTINAAGGSEYSTYYYARPALLGVTGTLVNAGTMQFNGGYVNAPHYGATGAILSVTGTIDNTGTISLESPRGSYQSTGATLALAGVLTNTGQIVEGGATIQISGTLTNIGTIASYPHNEGFDGDRVYISASGLLIDPGAITGAGTLDNAGTFSSGLVGVTTGTVTLTIVNTGTIDIAANGAFAIDGPLSGIGQVSIAAGGVLTIGAAAGSGQTVDFAGTQSVLALAAPTAFYATIEGLRPGTTIDVLKTGISAAVASGTTLDLTLTAGGTLDLTLAAPLPDGEMLALQSDQHGGTDLTVSQNPAVVAAGSGSYGLTGHDASGAQPGIGDALTVHLLS